MSCCTRWIGMSASSSPRGRGLVLCIVLLLPLLLVACQARPASTVADTNVGAGDVLRGRLAQGRPSQTFTFEGVESSVLDFHLVSDEASYAAPEVAVLDPEGRPVDVAPFRKSADGAATVKVEGVVLLRTGSYQVTVTPALACSEVYYRFTHELVFPPIESLPVTLTPCDDYPVYVSAPRGGLVTVKVTPKQGVDVSPEIRAVEDPWGGRALDSSRRPQWSKPATITTSYDGSIYLNFTAPIPGRYRVLAGAKDGMGGPVLISTTVRKAPLPNKAVLHPNRPADAFGMPAAGSASDG